jgi:glycosyltransferase involved in cell wall biosynthesis
VSVIITCYNQGRFLEEAIGSVCSQTYDPLEIIVIDDGSTDNTAEVAAQYSMIRYVNQRNLGLSAARNRGIRESKGAYLVFLDADDRLLPKAIEAGVTALARNPSCAFVFGDYRHIALDGSILWEPRREQTHADYLALLARNFIGMHGTVMYRSKLFDDVGPFDAGLKACEDYELYLRVSRQSPICHHGVLVAEYRQHHDSMSRDTAQMLRAVLSVLRSQKKHFTKDESYRRAYKQGLREFAAGYAVRLCTQIWVQLGQRDGRKRAFNGFIVLCRHYPLGTLRIVMEALVRKLRKFKASGRAAPDRVAE